MQDDRRRRLEDLFHIVRSLPKGERRCYVERECSDDPELASEVLELVELDGSSTLLTEEVDGGFDELAAKIAGFEDLTAGSRLGRYELGPMIGQGGMGQVYRARDAALNRDVAIKMLPLTPATTRLEERFHREAQILAKLSHPNIVRVHDAGRQSSVLFLVMDHIDGRPLSAILDPLKEGSVATAQEMIDAVGGSDLGSSSVIEPRSWLRTAAKIMVKTARAMETAHQAGILHRDLKPANVMIQRDGEPIVLDFGLARVDGTPVGSMTQGLVGSPAYLAPEQISEGRTGASRAVDVYQLGLCLYELLTRRQAFQGNTVADISVKVQRGDFPWPRKVARTVPLELEAICLKAIDLQPNRRYASAEALADDLERWLNGHPVHARRPGFARQATSFIRRRPAASMLAPALTLGLGIGAWIFWAGDQEPIARSLVATIQADGVNLRSTSNQPVTHGDYLGFDLELDAPTACRVFYVARARDGNLLGIHPAATATNDQLLDPNFSSTSYVEELDEGHHRRWAAKVDEGFDGEPTWRPELWLIFADHKKDLDDPRFRELEERFEDIGALIPYEEAKALLQNYVQKKNRGGLRAVPEESRGSWEDAMAEAEIFEQEEWDLEGTSLKVVDFPWTSTHSTAD